MRVAPLLVLTIAASLFAAPAAQAALPPGHQPAGKVLLGLGGTAIEPPTFNRLTGGIHDIHLITISWNESRSWNDALVRRLEQSERGRYRLMVHIGPGRTPGEVARGVSDRYLLGMGAVLNRSGQYAYVRPPAEMNTHWSTWGAFNRNGTRRGANNSTLQYRRAFIRIALITRGGDVARINTALRNNGMPPLNTAATTLPRSGKLSMVWNPQGRGAPDVRGNQPIDYYPGRYWVDYVANDMYIQSGRAAWTANDAMYVRFSRLHPYMMAEYAPWGYDDAAFVRRMFAWAATHPRVAALIYFNGTGGTTFRLATKPRSLAAYRTLVKQARYRCATFSAFVQTCTVPTT